MFNSSKGHAFEIPKFFMGLAVAVQIPVYAAVYSQPLSTLDWHYIAGCAAVLSLVAAIAYFKKRMVPGVFAGSVIAAIVSGYFLPGQSVLIGDLTVAAMILQIAVADILQPIHSLERALPVVAHFRRLFEQFRDEIRQYLIEPDDKGQPANRLQRNIVYRLSKGESTEIGLGSTIDYTAVGALRIMHSENRIPDHEEIRLPTFVVGADLQHPWYVHGRYGEGDGSFGSFGSAYVQASASGQKFGLKFMQRPGGPEIRGVISTGEGSFGDDLLKGVYIENSRMKRLAWRTATALSALNSNWKPDPLPRVGHLGCGDIMYEIGTGNFGCCNPDGSFNEDEMLRKAALPEVVAVKWKESQGAKPGDGAILPGAKVTPEIAAIRQRPVGVDCISPNRREDWPDTPTMLERIRYFREKTQKPQGIKFCFGEESFFRGICEYLAAHRGVKYLDFIHVDGGEGGTGAAKQSSADNFGMSIKNSLPLVDNMLREYGLRDEIIVISSGKAYTPAEVYWHLCMGADYVMAKRAFMLGAGCLQTGKCHLGECPVGITTHHPWLKRAFNTKVKYLRLAQLTEGMHKELISFLRKRGKRDTFELTRDDVRIVEQYAEVKAGERYPYPQGKDQPRVCRTPKSLGLPECYDPRVHATIEDARRAEAALRA